MTIDRRRMLALGAGTAALAAAGAVGVPSPASAWPDRDDLPSDRELARSLRGFRSHRATVNGTRLHYVAGGRGEPLVLLHGWPQTWWEYRKVMPELARHYRVIAVDLRGIGGSGKPVSGYEKKNMARDIYELAGLLGYSEINVAGHDIGSQVAFSFAANHPEATRRVALLGILHPDEGIYGIPLLPTTGGPGLWWHAFNQVQGLPEQLLSGRARHLIEWVLHDARVDQTVVSQRDRAIYARAYDYPDAIRGSNGWFQAWHQDIVDQRDYLVTSPMLGLAPTGFFFDIMNQVLPTRGTDVRVEPVDDTGHYFIEQRPETVVDAFIRFFG
jgi:pimeloyl-ACP methyl ester carboxylesterase